MVAWNYGRMLCVGMQLVPCKCTWSEICRGTADKAGFWWQLSGTTEQVNKRSLFIVREVCSIFTIYFAWCHFVILTSDNQYRTRNLCYRKDDRMMRPIYELSALKDFERA